MHVVPVVPLPLFGYDDDEPSPAGDTFVDVNVDVHLPAPPQPEVEHYVDSSSIAPQYVADWNSYVGQQPIKDEIGIYIEQSFALCEPLPHILLAAAMPGAGKTTLARVIAQEVGQRILMLVPPLTPDALYEAAQSMNGFEIMFIDEIHKLADHGSRAQENLLHMLEERVLYLNGQVIKLADFTVIGATTAADKLDEPLLDRFPVQPYFQPYSVADMVRIVHNFCKFYDIVLLPETMVVLAKASRRTPRLARSLVEGAKALQVVYRRPVTGEEVLTFKRTDPDGITRLHKSYVLSLYDHGKQYETNGAVVYRAGVDTMTTLLRQNPNGIARIERVLIEMGLLRKTGRGRILTDRGVAAALRYQEDEKR